MNRMKTIIEKYKERIPVRVLAEILADIDEAEREENCIWKGYVPYGWIVVPPHEEGAARNRDDLKNRPYCSVCGKKIKVVDNEADI